MRWIYYENCIIPAALQGFAPEVPQGSTGDPIYRVLRRLSYLIIYTVLRRYIRPQCILTLFFAILHPCYILAPTLDPPPKLWYYNLRKEQTAQKI